MRTALIATTLFGLSFVGMAGCPPQPAPTPSTDASVIDAAPTPPPAVVDASPAPIPTPAADSAPPPPPSTDPCVNACNQMNTVGCTQQPDCAKVLNLVQANRTNRNPKTKNSLTCADLVKVTSSADVKANGWNCAPGSK